MNLLLHGDRLFTGRSLLGINEALTIDENTTINTYMPSKIDGPPEIEPKDISGKKLKWETVFAYFMLALFLLLYLLSKWLDSRTKRKHAKEAKERLKKRIEYVKNHMTIEFSKQNLDSSLKSFDIEAQLECTIDNPQEAMSQSNRQQLDKIHMTQEENSDTNITSNEKKEDSGTIEAMSIGIEDDWKHTCAICYEQFNLDDDIASSINDICCHYFHLNCIMSWLTIDSNHHSCPMCRNEFVGEETEEN
ncbi:hypothetical protein CTEN210_11620 [Chaetoceros tenuissimus]|uniref:RING-type domain-containing protein n=1 Tax=Chaetoceros tenuissimus TaxID=426638 RepID=A0AAD3H9Q3_9STRA|nr:hypothetical protein CTEN210_11620 [Chaetoceros tenuissimus]